MKKIINNFHKIFLFFLYLQPFLDVSSGILIHFGYNITISSIIRIIFSFLCIIYLLFQKNKKINCYLITLSIYFILFTIVMYITKSPIGTIYELKDAITTYYFIVTLITLTHLYKSNSFKTRHLINVFLIYLLLVFIPNIFNIGFNSYWHSKLGSTGWFLSANVVGSILSILLPIIILNKTKINIIKIILAIIYLYVIFSIGTKVPVLAFFIIIIFNLLLYFIKLFIQKKYKSIFIIIAILVVFLVCLIIIFPKTSFYKNLIIHNTFLQENNKTSTYEMVDNLVFSQRLTFEKQTRSKYINSTLSQKLFGIGYTEIKDGIATTSKTVEMDYFDILYRHGIVGFIIFFAPLIYIVSKIKLSAYLLYDKFNIALSILLIFILALFQGHIFVTPAISIFVSLIISLTYNKKIKTL